MNPESQLGRIVRGGVARAGRAPAARDRLLFRRYRDADDPVDRDELVRRFMPLARQLAARYAGGGEPYDDLLQVACLALVRAIDRFDPDRGVAFSSFAVPTIRGEIKRHYRDRTWVVRVPRELAERLNVSESAVHQAVLAGHAHSAMSLEVPRGEDDAELTLGETIQCHERGYDVADARASLDWLLGTLCRRDREVLRLRFEEDLTQREIGLRIGVSQMHVSRIIRGAIEELGETAERLAPASAWS